jgi:hypothetical protein
VVTGNAIVDEINGIDMNNIVNVKQENVYLKGDLILDDLDVLGDVIGQYSAPCDLDAAERLWTDPPFSRFEEIIAEGNLYWNYESGEISRIFDKIVSKHQDSVIDAEVCITQSTLAILRKDSIGHLRIALRRQLDRVRGSRRRRGPPIRGGGFAEEELRTTAGSI